MRLTGKKLRYSQHQPTTIFLSHCRDERDDLQGTLDARDKEILSLQDKLYQKDFSPDLELSDLSKQSQLDEQVRQIK